MLFPLLLSYSMVTASMPPPPDFNAEAAARFAELALTCVHREYPNKIAHVMSGDADARPPRELTPAFYGCYDWHSAVHGHWLLVRLARTFPEAPFAPRARQAVARSLTPANIEAEVRYLGAPGRVSFERPYGLAAPARGRAAGVGRSPGTRVVGHARATRGARGGAAAGVAPQALASHPRRRA